MGCHDKKYKRNAKTRLGGRTLIFLGKRLFCKRNVIIALILAISATIGSFFVTSCSNNFDQNPDVESIGGSFSTTLPTPTDNSTPADHDAKKSAYYAFYAMSKLEGFTAESVGECVTNVAFVSVSQKIKASRIVNSNEVYKESLSHSTFKGVGVRMYIKGDNYVIHNASGISSVDNVSWHDTANRISKESFIERFGFVANNVTGYVMTDETILSAEYLGEENGIYTYRYELDVVKSTGKLGLEMRTMAGSASMPIFERASLTISMDKNWIVTQTKTDSVYKVDMLGGVTCTESVTETFSNHGKKTPIPNVDFYSEYLDADITNPLPENPTATDYIMQGFGDYISGEKPLKANLTVNSNTIPLSVNANAHINLNIEDLSSLAVRLDLINLTYEDISLNNAFVGYKNQNLYIKANKLKALTTIEEIKGFLNKISPLTNFDLDELFSGFDNLDLTTLLADATVETKEDVATVTLPLTLGELELNVQMNFNIDEEITFTSLTACIGELNVQAVLDEQIEVSAIGEGYNSITPILDVISDDLIVKANLSIGDIEAVINFDLTTLCLDASIEKLAIGNVNLGTIKLKYLDNTVYFNVKGLNGKLNVSDAQGLIEKITGLLGDKVEVALPDLSALQNIDVMDLVSSTLNSLTLAEGENALFIETTVLNMPITIELSITEKGYSLSNIALNIDGNAISIAPTDNVANAIDLEQSTFYNIATLLNVIDENNEINLSASVAGLNVDINVNLSSLTVLAKTELFSKTLTAKLENQKIFLSYAGLNAYVQLSDVESILDKLSPIVGDIDLSAFENVCVQDIISSIVVTENNGLTISALIGDVNAQINLDTLDNALTIKDVLIALGEEVLIASPCEKATYSLGDGTFYNIATLLNVIDENNEINLSASVAGLNVDINVNLSSLSVLAKTELFGKTLTAKLENQKIFLSYAGLNAYVQLSDVESILDKLSPVLGDIDLSAFENVCVQDIISSITVTESDILSIAVCVGNINAQLNLNTIGNALTVKDLSATFDEIVVTATPSDKADYSMSDSKYYNLATLLDVIDENGNISFVASVGDVNVDITFNISTMELYASVEGVEVYVDVNNENIYARYPGVLAKATFSDIEPILDKLSPIINKFAGEDALDSFSLDGLKNIDVESIIASIVVTETDNALVVNLELDTIGVTVTLDTSTENLVLNNVVISAGTLEVSAIQSQTALDFEFDVTADYVDLRALVDDLAPALTDIFTNETLYASMTASLVIGDSVYKITECSVELKDIYTAPKANANITLVIGTVDDNGKFTASSTHKLRLVYLDPSLVAEGQPNAYLTYDNTANTEIFEGTFSTTKFDVTLEILKQIYKNIPELQDALLPLIVADEDGNPALPKFEIDFASLINNVSFIDNLLTVDVNGNTLNKSMESSVIATLANVDGNLNLAVPNLKFDDLVLSLNAKVGKPIDENSITDQTFEYTASENASDFSSINELLETLKNTSSKRHFRITGDIGMVGSGLLSLIKITNEVHLDVRIDVIDGKTYVVAQLVRDNVLAIWKDHSGTSTLYYDPVEEMIYIHVGYYNKNWLGMKKDYGEEFYKYTVDNFMADPMTPILKMIRLSSSLESAITSSLNKESTHVNTATIENTFIKYAYDGKETFGIDIDLTALTGDVRDIHVDIHHDASMNLCGLGARVNFLGMLNLTLNATLTTSDSSSFGAEVDVNKQVNSTNYPA